MKRILLVCCLFLASIAMELCAQLNLPIQKIGDTNFYVYKVEKKETIYGICKKLNLSKDDILKYNPNVADGLRKDQKLFFPVKDFVKQDQKTETNKSVTPKSFHHIVQRGETLYGLSKMYNISQDDIEKSNPQIKDGVKAGQILIIPQNITETISQYTEEDNTTNNTSVIYHTIKKGDTLFNVSNRYSTTIESILALNPGITPTNFKIDDVIKIQPNINIVVVEKPKVNAEFHEYKIKEGDTFSSIASSNGIKESDLRQANPDIKELKKNKIIYIPNIKAKVDTIINENVLQEQVQQIYDSLKTDNSKQTIDVALILPYMLNVAKANKDAKLYTEFYKGFLLAVDSLRQSTDKTINIFTYDTENNLSKVESILSNPELKNVDIIFAPDDMAQMDLICSFAKVNKIEVINTFIIKNDIYNSNEHFLQLNIPHSYMYAKVFDEAVTLFSDYNIIFISHEGSAVKDIIPDFRKFMKEHNISPTDFKFSKSLKSEDLDSLLLPGEKYLLVPTNSSKSMLSKINIAIRKIKAERLDAQISVLGYPEWTSYLKEYKEALNEMDTYIYSRFFVDDTSKIYEDFSLKYKHWYGANMIYATPQFGLLGFDCGMFFITQLDKNGRNFVNIPSKYQGIQNDFNFERVNNWGGFINESLYFIHFSPNNVIEKITK